MYDHNIPVYSYAQVAKHDHPDDCWIVVANKVYDVSNFIKKEHPGGDAILGLAGRDATTYFVTNHSLKSWKLLEEQSPFHKKYFKGYVIEPAVCSDLPACDTFTYQVKQEVESKINKTASRMGGSAIFLTQRLAACVIVYTFMIMSGWYMAAGLCGCITFCFAGTSLLHESGHHSFSNNITLQKTCEYLSTMMLGVSHATWRRQHMIHHNETMCEGDPDTDHYPIFRRDPNRDKGFMFFHKYQHIYMYVLYCFLHLRFVTKDIIGIVTVNHIKKIEKLCYFCCLIVFLCAYLGVPLYVHGFLRGVIMFFTFSATSGFTAAMIFNLNHLVDGSSYLTNDDRAKIDIGVGQVVTSHNFSTEGWIGAMTNYLTSGLNYQIEHHLFPTYGCSSYPEISKIVQKYCKIFKIPYNVTQSFFGAHLKHFIHMKSLAEKNK